MSGAHEARALAEVLLGAPQRPELSDDAYWLNEAEHVLASGWLAAHDAELGEQIAKSLETAAATIERESKRLRPWDSRQESLMGKRDGLTAGARIAREVSL